MSTRHRLFAVAAACRQPTVSAALLIAALVVPLPVCAHGIIGARFFPATIATDDPFAADELAGVRQVAVVDSGMSEFLVQFNSGGVTATVPYVPLPWAAMRVVDIVDRVLVAVAPGVFASQRRLVLRRL